MARKRLVLNRSESTVAESMILEISGRLEPDFKPSKCLMRGGTRTNTFDVGRCFIGCSDSRD